MLLFFFPAIWKVRRSECDKDHWTWQESTVSSWNWTNFNVKQYHTLYLVSPISTLKMLTSSSTMEQRFYEWKRSHVHRYEHTMVLVSIDQQSQGGGGCLHMSKILLYVFNCVEMWWRHGPHYQGRNSPRTTLYWSAVTFPSNGTRGPQSWTEPPFLMLFHSLILVFTF